MTRRLLPAVALVVVVGCTTLATAPTGVTRDAVTSGTIDGADPAVVALVDADGEAMCTGTLIAPHVVLTAAHCGIDATTYAQYRAYFGSSPAGGSGTFVALSAASVHPQYDDASLANDLALVVLASDVAAAPIPMLAGADDGGVLAGATMRVVGFGRAGDAGTGVKRSGTSTVTSVAATTIDLAPDPSLPCEGDSGGPGLITVGATEYLASVTSHGDAACASDATDTRVDAYLASFIQPFLDSVGSGTSAPGARCLYPEQCAASTCVVAVDDPNIAYCAAACTTSASCPAKTTCEESDAGRLCLYPLPTPGATGAACKVASDCVDGDCIAGGVCSTRCVSGDDDCTAGFTCENTSGIDFYCIAKPPPSSAASSSCAVDARGLGSSSPSWIAIVLGALAAGRTFRRRRSPTR